MPTLSLKKRTLKVKCKQHAVTIELTKVDHFCLVITYFISETCSTISNELSYVSTDGRKIRAMRWEVANCLLVGTCRQFARVLNQTTGKPVFKEYGYEVTPMLQIQ